MAELQCDYLVVGAGAVGMAFVDTLLDESDASVVMVDKHHLPGGHWNDAYPFVRLHQPSHFYGVRSTELGSRLIDETGSNAGYYELATGNEVQSYFERIMRERFLPSGRVQYYPMSEYVGDNQFRNLLSGDITSVQVAKRRVDSTYFETSVPSRHQKNYTVGAGVTCIAPNQLPQLASQYTNFCIIGAGKTAMDAGVWLLDNGAAPQDVHWVCPRRSWMINRKVTQASVEFFKESIGGFAAQMQALAEATSVEDLFARLEDCGFMLRIDQDQQPEMFHYATISAGEVEQLRRIDHVIQKGRVASIEADGMTMTSGEVVAMAVDTLYVDCSASAVNFKHVSDRPVFDPDVITIQPVRMPNPCLSASVSAFVEFRYDDDVKRNQLTAPIPLPDDPVGFMRSTLGNMMNQVAWSNEPELRDFVTANRLDGFGAVIGGADLSDPEHTAILEQMQQYAQPAVANLWKLLS
ncbi:MAG: NAD(P)/FAD-dependent oxidoreductase [Pseudomonadota bacterium]